MVSCMRKGSSLGFSCCDWVTYQRTWSWLKFLHCMTSTYPSFLGVFQSIKTDQMFILNLPVLIISLFSPSHWIHTQFTYSFYTRLPLQILGKHNPELSVGKMKCNLILWPRLLNRFFDPAAISGARETKQGPSRLSISEERGRKAVFSLYETLPCLHSELWGKAAPAEGDHTLTCAVQQYLSEEIHFVTFVCIFFFYLKLLQQGGVLSLIDCTLIEEPDANDEDCKCITSTK